MINWLVLHWSNMFWYLSESGPKLWSSEMKSWNDQLVSAALVWHVSIFSWIRTCTLISIKSWTETVWDPCLCLKLSTVWRDWSVSYSWIAYNQQAGIAPNKQLALSSSRTTGPESLGALDRCWKSSSWWVTPAASALFKVVATGLVPALWGVGQHYKTMTMTEWVT